MNDTAHTAQTPHTPDSGATSSTPSLRRGRFDDQEWLFELFRQTMQHYIHHAWGWEELLQREGFRTSLPARGFQILQLNGNALGSYHLTDRADSIVLDMILVEPEMQRKGYGTLMMNRIKDTAKDASKPVTLSVLKSNPALHFHHCSGFVETEEDEHSVKMSWSPS